jgi:flagellar basal body-associated protein FliL
MANADELKRDILAVVNQYLSTGQIDQILLEDYIIK